MNKVNKIKESRFANILDMKEKNTKYGTSSKQMPISSHCQHHNHFHAELLDFEKVVAIYSPENVPDGCVCSVINIILDEQGNPLSPKLVERARAKKS